MNIYIKAICISGYLIALSVISDGDSSEMQDGSNQNPEPQILLVAEELCEEERRI